MPRAEDRKVSKIRTSGWRETTRDIKCLWLTLLFPKNSQSTFIFNSNLTHCLIITSQCRCVCLPNYTCSSGRGLCSASDSWSELSKHWLTAVWGADTSAHSHFCLQNGLNSDILLVGGTGGEPKYRGLGCVASTLFLGSPAVGCLLNQI